MPSLMLPSMLFDCPLGDLLGIGWLVPSFIFLNSASIRGTESVGHFLVCQKLKLMTSTSASEVFALVDDRKSTSSASCKL